MQKIFSPELSSLYDELKNEARINVSKSLSPELKEKVATRGKLSVKEQVEYMKAKGISFDIYGEKKAQNYLSESSYYYKVTAYRKNFSKNSNGYYDNLDFAHLVDLATIDMHLRYLVIKLSLDLEHSLKNLIIRLITDEDCHEDGYSIIDEYDDYEKSKYEKYPRSGPYICIRDKFLKEVRNKRDYNFDLISKSKDSLSIWVLVELMSYGQLCSFINFYVEKKKHKSKELKLASEFLNFSKNIRDSAAHSRPILLNITEENQLGGKPSKIQIKNYLTGHGLDKRVAARLLTNFKIHDLCSLIYLHSTYITNKYMRKSRKGEMLKIYKRSLYKKSIYESSTPFDDISNLFYLLLKKY